jgi:nucleotide-binding universal stress UspA family protein
LGGKAEAYAVLGEDILADARKILDARGELHVSYISRAGDPGDEIVACACEWSADALYLGSRGLGPVGGFLLGSVSRRITASAPCAVVIVPKRA